MTDNQDGLKGLFSKHGDIIRMAINRTPLSSMRQAGKEAVETGVVEEKDPYWMYSDDPRVRNGFELTETGRAIAEMQGWACACAGHRKLVAEAEYVTAFSLDGVCSACQGSLQAFGENTVDGQTSCKMCSKSLERVREEGAQPRKPSPFRLAQ